MGKFNNFDKSVIIPKSEHITLYEKMKLGDEDAKNKLIETCTPYICKMVNSRFGTDSPYYDDLISECVLHVCKKIHYWNPEIAGLLSFVRYMVFNHLKIAYAKQAHIYLNTKIRKKLKYSKEEYEAQNKFTRLAIDNARISTQVDAFSYTMSDKVQYSVPENDNEEIAILCDARKSLSPKENSIIDMHYFQGMTMEEVGSKRNVSRQAIQQNMRRIFKKLRLRMEIEKNYKTA